MRPILLNRLYSGITASPIWNISLTIKTVSPSRLSKSGQEIEIENGHTHEEWGGPGRNEICAKIIGHFSEKAHNLMYNVSSIPSPDDAIRWESGSDFSPDQAGKQYCSIGKLLESGGMAYAEQFVQSQNFTLDESADFNKIYLQYYLNENRYAELVSLFTSVTRRKCQVPDGTVTTGRIMLEQYTDAYETAKKMTGVTNTDTYEFTVHAAFFHLSRI